MPALRCRGFNVWSRLNRVPLWRLRIVVSSPTQLSNFIYCSCHTYTLIFSTEWAEQLCTPVSLIKRSPEFSRRLLPTSSQRAKYWRNLKSGLSISIDSSRLTWKHHLQSVNCWTSVCLSYDKLQRIMQGYATLPAVKIKWWLVQQRVSVYRAVTHATTVLSLSLPIFPQRTSMSWD